MEGSFGVGPVKGEVTGFTTEVTPLKEISLKRIESVAIQAGEIVLAEHQRQKRRTSRRADFKSEQKQAITEADLASQVLLRDQLLFIHNGKFVGEEDDPDPRVTKEVTGVGDEWVIDPFDGTENAGRVPPAMGVSIGLLRDGEPVMGVIYDPIQRIIYSGKKGEGATMKIRNADGTWDEVPMQVSDITDPREAIVGIDYSSNPATRVATLKMQEKILAVGARSVKVVGAPVQSLAGVASGELDFFARPATKLPDLVAGVALVREAGGVVVDNDGNDWTIGAKGIVAGPRALVDAYKDAFSLEDVTPKETEKVYTRPEKPSIKEVIEDPDAFTLEKALPKLLAEQAEGKTIVVTNGHFVFLHEGHESSMFDARKAGMDFRGDASDAGVVLLVIVNADHQTRLKDPIKAAAQPARTRATNVLGNRQSDYVIVSGAPEGDKTLVTDFRKLTEGGLKLLYVKGGDYGVTENVPPEAEIVLANGGEFKIVERVGDYSTSNQLNVLLEEAKRQGRL